MRSHEAIPSPSIAQLGHVAAAAKLGEHGAGELLAAHRRAAVGEVGGEYMRIQALRYRALDALGLVGQIQRMAPQHRGAEDRGELGRAAGRERGGQYGWSP